MLDKTLDHPTIIVVDRSRDYQKAAYYTAMFTFQYSAIENINPTHNNHDIHWVLFLQGNHHLALRWEVVWHRHSSSESPLQWRLHLLVWGWNLRADLE